MSKKKYTDDSIITLSPRDFTRKRPATYLGDNTYSTQLVREVFSNALDEHLIGNGKRIMVYVDTKRNFYQVEDEGQGFPINKPNKEGDETILQAAFDKLNTSGKYDENGVYGGAVLGLNGIGSKLVNFLSECMEVMSYNGTEYEHLWFKDGIFEKRDTGAWENKTTGTLVSWVPDKQFFQNVEANKKDLTKLFNEICALCPELTIVFQYDGDKQIINHTNGLTDLLNDKVKDKELFNNRFKFCKKQNDTLFDIALTYTTDYSESVTAYVNYGLTESGIHISTLKSLLTKQINKYATDHGFIKKESDEFGSNELSEGLVVVFNLKAYDVKYDSQTKVRVVDIDRSLMRSVINTEFNNWLENNPREAKIIIDRAMQARKAKEAAQKAKDGIRNAKATGKKFINLPTKLVDAYSKDRGECELFITEGDSAANGLIAKRDGKTQAVFPIRGKVLSCRKASPDKIYANQEISNIVKAIGLDINKADGKLIYDKKKLRYNKIILAADGDEDGANIRSLLINMFWWLCPELLENGNIYVAIPPLFRITDKKNNYVYINDKADLEAYKKKHTKNDYLVNRNKGLGEQSPQELAYCLLKPDTRNVKQILIEDAKECDDMLECFFGNKVEPRRDYLLNHYND